MQLKHAAAAAAAATAAVAMPLGPFALWVCGSAWQPRHDVGPWPEFMHMTSVIDIISWSNRIENEMCALKKAARIKFFQLLRVSAL